MGKQYKGKNTLFTEGESPADILAKLKALGKKAKPKDVNRIIGNDSWTQVWCSSCDATPTKIVDIREDKDHNFYLCKKCLLKDWNCINE